jgi:quercetin dioxygenase-like cupin family protein
MPTIIGPDDIADSQTGDGWQVRTVADAAHLGAPAMTARWWTFEPGARGPSQQRGRADEMLYVVRGGGSAVVDGQSFELTDESVLWVEEGETYYFVAGEDGLEILQGVAPGDAADG